MNLGLGRVHDGDSLAELLGGLKGPITLEEMEAALKNTSPSTASGLDGVSLADI